MRALVAMLLFVPLAASGQQMGTAHPMVVREVAPDGHWAYVCQARESKELTPYFIDGKGAGERVDELLSFDRAGRFVALRVGGKLVLVDTVKHVRKTLGAIPEGAREQVSIDATGAKLMYPRGDDVVFRDLPTGKERWMQLATATTWAGKLAPGGRWLMARVARIDTDGDGKIAMPVRDEVSRDRCSANDAIVRGMRMYAGERGDRPISVVVDTTTLGSRDLDDVLHAEGNALVRRISDEIVIEWAGPTGKTTPVVPASCKGRLRWVDVARETAIVECRAQSTKDNGPTRLVVFRRGEVLPMLLRGWAADRDTAPTEPKRLYAANDADGSQFFDGATDRAVAQPDPWIAMAGAAVLLYRRSDGALIELRVDPSSAPADLGLRIASRAAHWLPHAVTLGTLVAVEGELVDLAKADVVGAYDDVAVAIGADGRVLVRPKSGNVGPLVWRGVKRQDR